MTTTPDGPSAGERRTVGRADRRDWLVNRDRIHAAGRAIFASRAPSSVQLEDIAAEAGVSRATLLRHIGSKAELVAALYDERIDDVVGLATDALARSDPWLALAEVIRRLAEWHQADRGLFDFLRSQEPTEYVRSAAHERRRAKMVRLLGEVLARAQAAGVARPDLLATDLTPLLGYAHIYDPGGRGSPDRLPLYTSILLDGIRAGAAGGA